MIPISRKTLISPLNIGLAFTLFTLVLFVFGPYRYPNFCGIWLYLFLFIAYLSIYLGFKDGLSYNISVHEGKPLFPIRRVINYLFIISLILSVPKFYIYSGFPELSPSFIAYRALLFFSDAQELYSDKIDAAISVTGTWRYINWVIVFFSPFTWAYSILAVVYWKNLSTFQKLGSVFIWFLYALEYLITGTNFGLFDLLITIGIAFLASRLRENPSVQRKKKRKRKRLVYFLLFGTLFFTLLWIFDSSMSSRIGDTFYNGGYIANKPYSLDENRFLYRITPSALQPVLSYVTNYVAKPYSALSLAMTLPFEPTFGVGYSWFLLDNAPFSDFLWNRTYPVQIEEIYQYSHTINWHTAFTWFANDVSFYLVPFVLFILFRVFGRAWKEYLVTGNAAAFLLFMIYVKMMFFLSANNQVFQGPSTTLAFWLLVFTRKYFQSYNWSVIK